jgi:hypothetical protein
MIINNEKLLRLVHIRNDEYNRTLEKLGTMKTATSEQVKATRDFEIVLAQLKNAGREGINGFIGWF